MKQLRGFKFRFYPSSSQKLELAKTFGCGRYIYNWALGLKIATYEESKQTISSNEISKELTKLKKDPEKPWLKQVSSVPLQQQLRHLEQAFKSFFKGTTKYPRFKKKVNRQSATYTSNAFQWRDGKLTLAKMKEPLDIRWSRYFAGEPSSVTISKDPASR